MNQFNPGAEQAQGKKTVCIAQQEDGTFMVYDQADEQSGQPAADIATALDAAGALFGAAAPGEKQEAQPDEGDALFQQGFDQTRGVPLNRG